MRTARSSTLLMIVVILLAGCAGAEGNRTAIPSAPSRPTSDTSTSATTGIPDGEWTRVITTAEITRRGLRIAPAVITANYLDDGSVRLVLKTRGSRWSILVEDDDGAFEVGDQGETSYDSSGRWVQTGDSTGSSVLIDWTVGRDTLKTSISASTPGPPPEDGDRLFLEGEWQGQG